MSQSPASPVGLASVRAALWPILVALALVVLALRIVRIDPDEACPDHGSRLQASMVCLGDGSMLDPRTSLVWLKPEPGQVCAALDPLASWRPATAREIATLPPDLLPADQPPAAWCVIDQLARVLPLGPEG